MSPLAPRRAPAPAPVLLVALLVVLLAIVGVLWSGDPATAAPGTSTTMGKRTVRPAVGECHDLTGAQVRADADVTAPVPCSRRHTTWAVAVFDLPAGVAFGGPRAAVFAQERCYRAVRIATGARSFNRLALSAFDFATFIPTKPQRSAGHRFVRCDLVLRNGSGILPLPLTSDPLLRRGIPERYRRCNNDTTLYFPCTRPHRNRAVASFSLTGTAYPGDAQQREDGAQRCTELVGRTLEYFYYPAKPAWQAGYRAFTCLRRVT